MKQPAFQRTSVLSAFLICLFACMAVLCMTATEAFASTSMTLRSGYVSDPICTMSHSGDQYVDCSSSNPKVAQVILEETGDGATTAKIIGLYPGKATVKATLYEDYYYEDWCEYDPIPIEDHVVVVTVTSSGAIRTAQCDGLYKGVKYTKEELFTDYDFVEFGSFHDGSMRNASYEPWFVTKPTLKLAAGTYSKASTDGKYVKFINTGTCTVNAKYSSKTYKITVGKVHSGAATRDAFQKKVKAEAKAKGYTYKLVAAKVYNSKGLGYKAVAVKYTLTKGGKTITRTGSAWFYNGKLQCDYKNVK